jgi:hypothetical protein
LRERFHRKTNGLPASNNAQRACAAICFAGKMCYKKRTSREGFTPRQPVDSNKVVFRKSGMWPSGQQTSQGHGGEPSQPTKEMTMSQFMLEFVLGAASTQMPGQWLEGSVEFGKESFTLSADVCRSGGAEEFSMYRLHQRLDQPFTAEMFLGLLSLIAEDEFRPSMSGIELSYSGDGAAPTAEIARIMEPKVRGNASLAVVPASVAAKLHSQMQRISLMRRVQSGMAHLDT